MASKSLRWMALASFEYCRPIASHVGDPAFSIIRHCCRAGPWREAAPVAGATRRNDTSQKRYIARSPTGAGRPFSAAGAALSWRKLVQLSPEPAGTDAEGGAELGIHMRLVAIAKVGCQHGERRPFGA